jgi:hypothetical protein
MSHDQAMTTVQEPTAMEPTAMEKDEAKVREITIFAMTIGELLDLLDNYPHDDSSTADEPLRLILICAACFYDDRECDLRSTALYLARLALQEDSIGKETAAAMAHYGHACRRDASPGGKGEGNLGQPNSRCLEEDQTLSPKGCERIAPTHSTRAAGFGQPRGFSLRSFQQL